MKAERKRRWNRYIAALAAIAAAFGLSVGVKLPVYAATTIEECAGFIILFDSDGEAMDMSTAVIVQSDSEFGVYTKMMDGDAAGSYALLGTGTENIYLLEYRDSGTINDYELSYWALDSSWEDYANAFSDPCFLEMANPYQNDRAFAVYYDQDLEDIESTSVTLLECDENGFLTLDQYPDIPASSYPSALVNGEGELVGICLDNRRIWAIGNGEVFYSGSAAGSQPEETAPPLPDREDRQPSETQENPQQPSGSENQQQPSGSENQQQPSGSENQQQPSGAENQQQNPASEGAGQNQVSDSPASDSKSDETEEGSSLKTIWIIAAAAAVIVIITVVIVVIVLLSSKKKRETAALPTPPFNPASAAAPGSYADPVPYTVPMQYSPMNNAPGVPPVPAPPKEQKLWLVSKGGCMNGRVYPVEKDEITIGRDVSSTIRYPADTAGVSRVHAKLYWQGNQLMLMDCNSTSGTFLQRQGKLTPMAPVKVQSGDVFYVGEKINSFEIKN